ncbi:hypothetical protein GUITHDRAFT_110397 [Guillardia theta CCMP2712]|uniref:Uncharacterized protein n=1 Tax=Guillardia theta (strain CCMP2712) TaxID=905079 RepID=L1J5G8_GUITC|nr:hypothetical protein GUITHDRAFT_110397 [Guillardia theta CCMP2712]EKX43592.1 hypothetical protein GUITHDRAFT_110397 [Guillardia theta CCMP2712]|eukprot:XP_005830572.1 hypothetical protein GUITHDRAFT_110397 [Guillardia theta CCMP2712]
MNKNQPLMDWCNANPKLDFVFDEAGRPAKDIIIDCCAKIILSQLGAFHVGDCVTILTFFVCVLRTEWV